MTHSQKSSPVINILLWIAQVLLASTLVWASYMKLAQPIEQLSAMWPWTGDVPITFVWFTTIIDLTGAIGLILPALIRVKPSLTPVAAVCLIVLMICASVFHISRGEADAIGFNIFFAALAGFVAWGRLKKSPIQPK